MFQGRLVLSLACGVLCIGMVGCGAGTPAGTAVVSPVPANVAGNWLLSGTLPAGGLSLSPPTTSNIALGIYVIGNEVVAGGTFGFACDNGSQTIGSTVSASLTGTVASDGSFVLTQSSLVPAPLLLKVSIQGTVPAEPGGPWTGTYTATSTGTTTCSLDKTASFSASPIAAVTGAYTGSGAVLAFNGGLLSGPSVSVGLQLQQGATLYSPGGPAISTVPIALSGSITLKGIPCFTGGVISSRQASLVLGDNVDAAFAMDDGSTLVLHGQLLNPQATSIRLVALTVSGGQCNGALFAPSGGWALTRQ